MKYSLLLSSLLHAALLAGWPAQDSPPHHAGHSAVITLALNPTGASIRTTALPAGSATTGRVSKKRSPAAVDIHSTTVAQAPRRAQWHAHRQNKPGKAASTTTLQARTAPTRHTTRPDRANTISKQGQAPVDIATLSHIKPPPIGPKGKNRERTTRQDSGFSARRLQSSLRHALAPYFHYPPLARRRGWEGVVKLGMHIDATGHLSQVRILRSSGYALLDQAARKSLRQVTVIPRGGHPSGRRGLDMVLPIQYRLVNG